MQYFKTEVKILITKNIELFTKHRPSTLPQDFWINHITCVFIETLRWWIQNQTKETPETIYKYFLLVI